MGMVTFTLCLPATFKEEDGWIVACFPHLDISSQGRTRDEAAKHLIEATQLFVESCYERGTLDVVLKECGFEPGHPTRHQAKDADHLTVPVELLASRNAPATHTC